MRILLVEDDLPLAQALQKSLQMEGFVANHVHNGRLALNALATPDHDMVILDLGLPDMDGKQVLKSLRAKNACMPVIILTARDTIESKVEGLDLGADDYLAKPFEMSELSARLRVVERRLGTATSAIVTIKNVELDTRSHEVLCNHNKLHFSKKEFMVLKALMENADRILSREQIESKLYHWGEEVSSNAVEVHIHKLRKHLPDKFIDNVRGVGYIIHSKVN